MTTKKEKSLSENVETIANLEGEKGDHDQSRITKTITRKRLDGKIEKIVRTGTSETKTEITYPTSTQTIWYRRLVEVLYERYEKYIEFKELKEGNPDFRKTIEYGLRKEDEYLDGGIMKSDWIRRLSLIIADRTPKSEQVNPVIEDLLDPDLPLVKKTMEGDGKERYSLTATGRKFWENKKELKESDPEWKINSLMDQACRRKI